MIPRTLRHLLPLALAPAALALACGVAPAPAAAASKSRVTGTATYRERMALTPAAVFEATLEDVSRADAPGQVIGQVRRKGPGQVPIAFEIPYDPRKIVGGRTYVVRASIYDGGWLRFASDQAYPVLTHGHGHQATLVLRRVSEGGGIPEQGGEHGPAGAALRPLPATFGGALPCADCMGIRYQLNLLPGGAYVQRMTYLRDGHDDSFYELGGWALASDGRTLTLDGGEKGRAQWVLRNAKTLRKLDHGGKSIESALPYDLIRRASFEPIEPRVRLTGMFQCMADAPRFRDCGSRLQWPVAMSDDYPELERAYLALRAAPGAELLVLLSGRVEQRAKMEGSGTEPTLVVERFVRAMPGQSCGGPAPENGLENTRWRPIRIGSQAVTVAAQQQEPWIVLEPRTKRVTGSGGCNRISGGYETGGDTLRFGAMISTQMACSSLETETAFLRALAGTRRYRVQGRILDLTDDRGRLLVRMEERNLK